jgi:hypothetical protein
MFTVVIIAAWDVYSQPEASAEHWNSFSAFIVRVDYVAQHQELVRDGKVIGKRIVREYWRDKDFDEKLIVRPREAKAWSFSEYNYKTDTLTTAFEFYGDGTCLWKTAPINGAILYPGISTDGNPGAEVACSITEFHELLLQIGTLKAAGKSITGLKLPRLGSSRPAVP